MSKNKTVEYQVQVRLNNPKARWLNHLQFNDENVALERMADSTRWAKLQSLDYEYRLLKITTEVLTKGDR